MSSILNFSCAVVVYLIALVAIYLNSFIFLFLTEIVFKVILVKSEEGSSVK